MAIFMMAYNMQFIKKTLTCSNPICYHKLNLVNSFLIIINKNEMLKIIFINLILSHNYYRYNCLIY